MVFWGGGRVWTGGFCTTHRPIQSWYEPGKARPFYEHANGVMITFFVEDRKSFDECRNIFANARTYLPDAPIMCCGMVGMGLCVLGDQMRGDNTLYPRVVTEAEARALCEELGIEYEEVDVAADEGRVETVFTAFIREMASRTALPPGVNDNTLQA